MFTVNMSFQIMSPCERFITNITGIHVVWSVSKLQMIYAVSLYHPFINHNMMAAFSAAAAAAADFAAVVVVS